MAAIEVRFREDLWRTAPTDAVVEAEVRMRHFGPVLVTVFGDLPDAGQVNLVQGAAEPGAVEGGHLIEAIEWARSREVDFRISVAAARPGTNLAEDWLAERGYEPASTTRRYARSAVASATGKDGGPGARPPGVAIRELQALETEGMSHIVTKTFGLANLATIVVLGLPDREGWQCYSASVDGKEAACGSLMILGEIGLLTLDATLPFGRRRGCQSALIARRVLAAAEAGCKTVVAEVCEADPATPEATSNLLRAGFIEVPGLTMWGRPTGIA